MPVIKMGISCMSVINVDPKPRRTYGKVTAVELISHFRGMLIVIFRIIKCFLVDSVLKFSA